MKECKQCGDETENNQGICDDCLDYLDQNEMEDE